MHTKIDTNGAAPTDSRLCRAEHIEAANAVTLFLKALKAYRLYLPNNRTLVRFVDTFHEALTAFTETHGELRLRVNQSQISFDGEPVYENDAKEESLAFRLFIHGVRELNFHEGVPLSEVNGFLQVIHRSFDSKTTVDDLLTLLWEKDLQYITFIILDDFFEAGEQAEFDDFVAEGQRADHTAGSMTAAIRPLVNRLQGTETPADPVSGSGTFDLTEEERDRIRDWVAEERDRDLIQDLLRVIMDLLRSDADEEDARSVLSVLDQMIETLLEDGKIAEVVRVFRQLRSNAAAEGASDAVTALVDEALEQIGGDRMVRLLGPHLARVPNEQRDDLIEFLVHLDQSALPAFIELLDSPQTKEIATRALMRLAPNHLGVLTLRLGDPRPSVVVAVIRLLSAVGDPRAIVPLKGPLHHHDFTIRLEAIRALAAIGTEAAYPILRDLLYDPEQEIRVRATRALTELPPRLWRDDVFELARSGELSRRTYFEKKEILLVLAETHDLEVEEWLGAVVRKRRWFRRQEHDELRACAVAALARLGTPAAHEFVQDCAQDRSPQVRRAALQALRRDG